MSVHPKTDPRLRSQRIILQGKLPTRESTDWMLFPSALLRPERCKVESPTAASHRRAWLPATSPKNFTRRDSAVDQGT
jgi:hypothetical protein